MASASSAAAAVVDDNDKDVTNFLFGWRDLCSKLPLPQTAKEHLLAQLAPTFERIADYSTRTREPRVVVVGQSGSGKSSLINALLSEYVADVGATRPETDRPTWHPYRNRANGEVLISVLDTAGFYDAGRATQMTDIERELGKCPADICFYVEQWSEARANDARGMAELEKLSKIVTQTNRQLKKMPVIAVLNKCDQADPPMISLKPQQSVEQIDAQIAQMQRLLTGGRDETGLLQGLRSQREELLRDAPGRQRKLANIDQALAIFHQRIEEKESVNQSLKKVSAVSCYMEWNANRTEVIVDRRWNIAQLIQDILQVTPPEIHVYLIKHSRYVELQVSLARTVIGLCATATATMGFTPIPLTDIPAIVMTQMAMIAIIRDISGKGSEAYAVQELFATIGTTGLGFFTRFLAGQLTDFIPVVGNIVGAAMAFSATWALGEAAIALFIEDAPRDTVQRRLSESSMSISQTFVGKTVDTVRAMIGEYMKQGGNTTMRIGS